MQSLPRRKAMATARRVSLFHREIRMHLSASAVDILLDMAEVISEGQPLGKGYFGSTMLTIDLARAVPAVREECDAASARQVAELLGKDKRVRARARALAVSEAEERAGSKLSRFDVEVRVRSLGTRIHMDLDVEGDLLQSSRAG